MVAGMQERSLVTESAPVTEISDAPATPSDDSLETQLAEIVNNPAPEDQPVEEGKPGDEETQPEAEPEAEPTVEREPQEDFEDLVKRNDAWKSGEEGAEPLSTEEKQRLRGYEQSVADQQRAQQQARQLKAENDRKLQEILQHTPQTILNAINAEITAARAENRVISPTLMRNALETQLNSVFSQAAPLALFGHEMGIRQAALELLPENPGVNQRLESASSFDQVLGVFRDAAYTRGMEDAKREYAESDAAKTLARVKKELSDAKTELQKFKSERGGKGSGPSTVGNHATPHPEDYPRDAEGRIDVAAALERITAGG